MSNNAVKGCFGCVLGIIGIGIAFWGLVYIGATFLMFFDHASQLLTTWGIKNPVITWSILGGAIGCFIGLVQGLKNNGRSIDIGKVYIVATALALFLLIGNYLQWQNQLNISSFKKTVLQENFAKSNSSWGLANGAVIKNGGLFHQVNRSSWSKWYGRTFKNVDFTADAIKVGGDNSDEFGLLARVGGANEQDFYYLLINGSGYFAMGKHSQNGWEHKLDWQPSKVIRLGKEINNLKIVCKGELMMGFVNNQRVGFFKDNSYSSGKIAVESGRNSDNAVAVYFDNIVVKEE